MDDELEITLKNIYDALKNSPNNEISINSPKYCKETVDYLKKKHLIDALDVSTFSGWKYIVKPTYEGKKYFEEKEVIGRERKKQENKEFIRFWLPIVISIISLIVSIVK